MRGVENKFRLGMREGIQTNGIGLETPLSRGLGSEYEFCFIGSLYNMPGISSKHSISTHNSMIQALSMPIRTCVITPCTGPSLRFSSPHILELP